MLLRLVFILIMLLPVVPVMPVWTQNSAPTAIEDSLFLLFEQFQMKADAEERQNLNADIINYMSRILTFPESLDYRFDSLRKRTGILDAPDGMFRIFTWNIPMDPFEHEIHGIIQVKGSDACRVHILKNHFDGISELLHSQTDKSNWPGALYYDILRNKQGKTIFYTLMGYNFHDRWSDKKIIEILHFDEELNPLFGKAVFNTPEGIQHRVVFEYSGEVAMNLRYNPDLKMIVYDHLSPIEPELKAHPRFYAPDFSYDGYKFRNGIWEHKSEVDVRNR